MMIQSSIITVLLVSTCFQSFTMVHAFEADDAAAFTAPFKPATDLLGSVSKVVPADGTNELVGGLVPDLKNAASGVLRKRDDDIPTDDGIPADGNGPKQSGHGVATFSDGPSGGGGGGALGLVDEGLLANLKKRYSEGNPQGETQSREPNPKANQGKASVSLINLRRRSDFADGNRGSATSDLKEDQSSSSGGHTSVSLFNLRRRNLLLGGKDAEKSTEGEPGTTISLIGKRANAGTKDRRSTLGLTGTERMYRARQGVVTDDQAKSGFMDRRDVYRRGDDHDRRIIEDYENLMKKKQEEYNEGQKLPDQDHEKTGTTSISLASLRRRLVDGVLQNLTGSLGQDGNADSGPANN
ncbi:hypothetical protein BCR42DRAFT_406214 [Absidia repens]|uniref:Uncharacterized protein n=1 Tax=Absidia repens TaxID=90262 RepID=A0A1X2IUK8_9FUNG|nr:hypothetical protein BCR42DRAFT_406214 [Absidia repens]